MFSFGICETFRDSGGCFWNQVTYYYVIKNYVGHKLAIFKAILFTLLHLLLTQWWDMRLKHDVAWLWQEQAESRNVCQNEKKYCSFRITLIRIDTILSNWYHYIYNNIQNELFRKLLTQSATKQTFWQFSLPADILWLPKTVGWVFGYTTALMEDKKDLYRSNFVFVLIFYWFQFQWCD